MKRAHKTVADHIIPILRDVFAEQRPCDKPGKAFQFGDRGWTLTPDESRSFHEAVLALSAAFQKVH